VKFILDHLITVVIAVLSGGGLLWLSLAPRGRQASPMLATQMINRGKSTAVIDVRSSDAYMAGHLRDAKHIPLAELATRIGELDKSNQDHYRCRPGRQTCRQCRTTVENGRVRRYLWPGRRDFRLDGCRPAADQINRKDMP
jgi:rhodanese-related sulfurtransferase